MVKCNSCNNNLQSEAFLKTYKTCAACLISRAEKRIAKKNLDNSTATTTTIESIALQTFSDYVAKLISNTENNNEISVETHLDLHDDIFSIATFDDPKTIVRIIIDKIEEGDDFSSQAQSSIAFSADGDSEMVDPEIYQQCKSKVAELG
ncbi:8743_t:CDS:2, partial [Dentiscutata erythropus]